MKRDFQRIYIDTLNIKRYLDIQSNRYINPIIWYALIDFIGKSIFLLILKLHFKKKIFLSDSFMTMVSIGVFNLDSN